MTKFPSSRTLAATRSCGSDGVWAVGLDGLADGRAAIGPQQTARDVRLRRGVAHEMELELGAARFDCAPLQEEAIVRSRLHGEGPPRWTIADHEPPVVAAGCASGPARAGTFGFDADLDPMDRRSRFVEHARAQRQAIAELQLAAQRVAGLAAQAGGGLADAVLARRHDELADRQAGQRERAVGGGARVHLHEVPDVADGDARIRDGLAAVVARAARTRDAWREHDAQRDRRAGADFARAEPWREARGADLHRLRARRHADRAKTARGVGAHLRRQRRGTLQCGHDAIGAALAGAHDGAGDRLAQRPEHDPFDGAAVGPQLDAHAFGAAWFALREVHLGSSVSLGPRAHEAVRLALADRERAVGGGDRDLVGVDARGAVRRRFDQRPADRHRARVDDDAGQRHAASQLQRALARRPGRDLGPRAPAKGDRRAHQHGARRQPVEARDALGVGDGAQQALAEVKALPAHGDHESGGDGGFAGVARAHDQRPGGRRRHLRRVGWFARQFLGCGARGAGRFQVAVRDRAPVAGSQVERTAGIAAGPGRPRHGEHEHAGQRRHDLGFRRHHGRSEAEGLGGRRGEFAPRQRTRPRRERHERQQPRAPIVTVFGVEPGAQRLQAVVQPVRHGRHRHAEFGGDAARRQAVVVAQQHGGALVSRQPVDRGDERAAPFFAFEQFARRHHAIDDCCSPLPRIGPLAAAALVGDEVAHHAREPAARPHDVPGAMFERPQERLLHDIVGFVGDEAVRQRAHERLLGQQPLQVVGLRRHAAGQRLRAVRFLCWKSENSQAPATLPSSQQTRACRSSQVPDDPEPRSRSIRSVPRTSTEVTRAARSAAARSPRARGTWVVRTGAAGRRSVRRAGWSGSTGSCRRSRAGDPAPRGRWRS
ncbi:MAG TPA: hypothetical protein VFZ65_11605 [Planctomycetota bacterium]|nr:hypothetical protein [Planctomycetota bacterium]